MKEIHKDKTFPKMVSALHQNHCYLSQYDGMKGGHDKQTCRKLQQNHIVDEVLCTSMHHGKHDGRINSEVINEI